METASLSTPLQKLLRETLLPLAPDRVALAVIQAASSERLDASIRELTRVARQGLITRR